MKRYKINEAYVSRQGEGFRVGTENVFLRFAGCNMRCDLAPGPQSPGGFACDTEFESGRMMTAEEIVDHCVHALNLAPSLADWVILTGGEPGLQFDDELGEALHSYGFSLAIETNGSVALPSCLDFISCSPKVAEHAVKLQFAHELRYVRGYGQALPEPRCEAEHYYISPAFDGGVVRQETVDWCKQLIAGTKWKLSLQQHKIRGER
jgi:organic radical activating enzyme